MNPIYNHKIYPWQTDETNKCMARGFAFYNGKKLSSRDLIEHLKGISNKQGFRNFLLELNGFFTLVLHLENESLAASDLMATFPLLYKIKDNKISFAESNEIDFNNQKLLDKDDPQINSFICSGFTIGSQSIAKEYQRLESRSLIHFVDGQITIEQYHPNFEQPKNTGLLLHFKERLHRISLKVFKRQLEFIGDQQVIIPLSGGYDSRFILAMLHQLKHKNILCFTYGRKDSFEDKIAKAVCEKLKIEWHFIEFNKDLFENYFSNSYQKYETAAFNGFGLVYEQDFLALADLKKKGLIQAKAFILSGLGGDILSGNWLPNAIQFEGIEISRAGLIKYISKQPKFFNQENPLIDRTALAKLIDQTLPKGEISDKTDWLNKMENWGIEQRTSRYHIGGMRAFEFFELNWLMPLWDKDFIEFWNTVPYEFRKDCKLYKSYLGEYLFEPKDINIYHENIFHTNKEELLSTKIKSKTPKWLKQLAKPLFIKRSEIDVLGYDYLCEMLYKKLSKARQAALKKNQKDLNLLEAIYFIDGLYDDNLLEREGSLD